MSEGKLFKLEKNNTFTLYQVKYDVENDVMGNTQVSHVEPNN